MVALAKPNNRIVQPQGKSNEWYTPAKYIEAAREVMGGIDLDPASCFEANQTVRASRFYSIEDNGLAQDWTCEGMFINPPYGMLNGVSVQGLFIMRLVHDYQEGYIKQAILLSTLRTDASWFQPLLAFPFCIVNHQIMFRRPGKKPEHNIHGSLFVYLGSHEHRFVNTFSQFGRIAKAIDTPRQEVTPIQLWEVQP